MIARHHQLVPQDVIAIDPFAPVSVVMVSPEEAASGIFELWQNDRLLATSYEQDSRIVLRFAPPEDGEALVVGATVLRTALDDARTRSEPV